MSVITKRQNHVYSYSESVKSERLSISVLLLSLSEDKCSSLTLTLSVLFPGSDICVSSTNSLVASLFTQPNAIGDGKTSDEGQHCRETKVGYADL